MTCLSSAFRFRCISCLLKVLVASAGSLAVLSANHEGSPIASKTHSPAPMGVLGKWVFGPSTPRTWVHIPRAKFTFDSSVVDYVEFTGAPLAGEFVMTGGPSAEADTLSNTVGCKFSLWDPSENLWDFTYEAWLKRSGGSNIAYGTHWVNDKSAINGELMATETTLASSYDCDVDWYDDYGYLGSSHLTFAPCGDDRDNIREEYRAGQVAWTPSCSDFATSGSSAHFTWSELNHSPGNGHDFGIVKAVLWTGLEDTRTEYNRGGIIITSGYRCPHGNAAVGGAQNSRHQYGDAADMKSADHTWNQTEWQYMSDAADEAGAGFIEPYSWDPDHLHADWR